ncbi:hypothetical protein [Nitrosomonas sp.]|uniref:hypothetical protein n=1 Tax=Nitrosomonas sp. TaxID=42353 RepID=UPI002600F80A|nr:hypothetical protein [Nitrosomonas sp.]
MSYYNDLSWGSASIGIKKHCILDQLTILAISLKLAANHFASSKAVQLQKLESRNGKRRNILHLKKQQILNPLPLFL